MLSCWQQFLRSQLVQPAPAASPASATPAPGPAPGPAPVPVPAGQVSFPESTDPAPQIRWPEYQIMAGLQAAGYQIQHNGHQVVLSPPAPTQSGYQRVPPPAPGSSFQGDSPVRSWAWGQQGQQWHGSQGNWAAQPSPQPSHQNTWGPQSSTWDGRGAQQSYQPPAERGAHSQPGLPAIWDSQSIGPDGDGQRRHQQPSLRRSAEEVLGRIFSRFGDQLPQALRDVHPAPATTNPVVVVNQGHQGLSTSRRSRTPSPANTGASEDPSKKVKAPSEEDAAAYWAHQVKGTGMRMM